MTHVLVKPVLYTMRTGVNRISVVVRVDEGGENKNETKRQRLQPNSVYLGYF